MFLTGGFPSADNPTKSIFNFRAARSLCEKAVLIVVHLRYWKPNRKFKSFLKYNDVNVIQLSLPWIPIEHGLLNSINLYLWKYLCKYLLKNELGDLDVIHSVGIDGAASIGSFIKKRNTKHVVQTIGSDLNFHWEKLKKYRISRGWENNVDIFVCNSKALERKINKEFPKNRSVTLYRGTDLEKFRPNDLVTNNRIRILYLGGFANRKSTIFGRNLKGGETLKMVWKGIEKMIMNRDVQLLLGGPSTDEEDLKEWIDTLENRNNVTCLGLLDVERIPDIIRSVEIVVVPSKAEGLPNVAVEALACEKLVIASNVGGIPEIVKDKTTGYLFENMSDFKKILLESIIHYNDTKAIRKNARLLIEDNFDGAKYSQKIFDLYSRL